MAGLRRADTGHEPLIEIQIMQGRKTCAEDLVALLQMAQIGARIVPAGIALAGRVEGLDPDTYLTVFGEYVLTPTVFRFLEEHIRMGIRERGEFQLTSCLERIRKEEGFAGLMVAGPRASA